MADISPATQQGMLRRNVSEFWDDVSKGAKAAEKTQPRKGNAVCWQDGTFQNPIRIESDRIATVVLFLLKFVGGITKAAEVPNPMAPDPVKDGILLTLIKTNVKPGQWFYFSTMEEFIAEWSGSGFVQVYDRKRDIWYDKNGNEVPFY